MTASNPAYKRAPSQELQSMMLPGGVLRPLVEVSKREVSGHCHDVHFRANEEVHVYRGLTRLLTVRKMPDGSVSLTADSTYKPNYAPKVSSVFGDWMRQASMKDLTTTCAKYSWNGDGHPAKGKCRNNGPVSECLGYRLTAKRC